MANTQHSVKANLYDNPLTDDPNDFVARVSSERALSVEDICASATTRGGADISASAMSHGVNLFLKELTYQLCNGFSVNTGYFTATPLIKGVFNSKDEKFDSNKHSLVFQFNQGDTLRKELSNVSVEIVGVADSTISILQVTDVKTASVNDLITPNRNLKIKGYKLKLVGDNANVGVYFVNNATAERTKVDPSDIVTNNPSELVIVIPALAAGTYMLEVTSQFSSGSSTLKEPKTALFDKELTVK